VKFTPVLPIASSGSFTITSNDPTNGSVKVGAIGIGVSGTLSVPATLSFGTVKVHHSKSLKLPIKNTGLGVLHGSINVTALAKPFSASGAGKFTLEPGKIHDVTVTFAPSAKAEVAGLIVITSDDSAANGIPVPVDVFGTGD
jgi:hypothetical protein